MFTGGVGVADDVLCYSAMATMILSVVEAEEVHKIEDCEDAVTHLHIPSSDYIQYHDSFLPVNSYLV